MNKLTKDILKEKFDGKKNLGDKPIFIDFYADWWGPCRMFEQVLNDVYPDYKDKIDMYKVDIEEEQDMAIAFGARSIPYMAFISKDGETTSQVGSLDKDRLKYFLEGLLSKWIKKIINMNLDKQ